MKIVTLEKEINENDEKLVLVSLLGVLIALERNSLSIAEAEKFLFSPYVWQKTKRIIEWNGGFLCLKN